MVIGISYLTQKNVVTERDIHPYKLFMYNNAWFVLAYDCKHENVLYFKLNRIEKFEIKNTHFRIPLTYVELDYLDEYGMKNNGEWYSIKLKLTGKYAMLAKERVYGKKQIVTPLDDGVTILNCEMQNKEDILAFALGFGTNCEVLEPEWLREKVLETATDLTNKY